MLESRVLRRTSTFALTLALITILAAPTAGAQEAVRRSLEPAVARLASSLPGRTVVGFGTFTYADKKLGSPFSRYLEETLATLMTRDRRFEVFERDKLDAILSAQELNLSDIVDQKLAVPVGNMKGIQALLSGTFFDAGDEVQVFLDLVSVEKATVIGRAEASVPMVALPLSVSVLPDNYTDALLLIQELTQVGAGRAQGLEVRAWCERGDGGVYRDGERLVVHLFANRDCFVRIYHIDVAGRAKLIFPNQYFKGDRVTANRIYRIPDDSYPFAFVLLAPYGTELIKVVASTAPFTDVQTAFADMGKADKDLLARGLDVTARDTLVAEAMFRYTIVK